MAIRVGHPTVGKSICVLQHEQCPRAGLLQLLSVSLGAQLLEGSPLSYTGLYPTPSTDLAKTLLSVCMRDKDKKKKKDNSTPCQCLLGALIMNGSI